MLNEFRFQYAKENRPRFYDGPDLPDTTIGTFDGSVSYRFGRPLTAAQNQRQIFSIGAVITGLAAGTYNVGMCGSSSVPANWNSNEYSYTSAMVLP